VPVAEQTRLSVCLTFDFDAMSSWIGSFRSSSLPALSRGEFGAHAVPRILELLRSRDITATFFVPGHTALAFPSVVCAIRDAGHEIGHHGWVHENPAQLSEGEEREVLEKGFAALAKAADVKPSGYRSPSCDFSASTPALLNEFGFLYDASCSASDFAPYYIRTGDRVSPAEPYQFGELTTLVEMPFSWTLDDFPHFEFVPGFSTAQSTPGQVREMWEGEFQYAIEHAAGGCFVLCLHPQVIGRGHRLTMLAEFIDRVRSHHDVVFANMGAYASVWKAANPMHLWRKNNALRTGVDAHRSL
jgi:peptidoglycan/xylan/chitin deacetylase (PgdA/CDA1 family)